MYKDVLLSLFPLVQCLQWQKCFNRQQRIEIMKGKNLEQGSKTDRKGTA